MLVDRIVSARDELQRLLDCTETRTRHAARSRVVIAGPPNAGKSTLFNALVGRSAALVSPIAGTTRDYLTADIEWQGLPIELVDTAGWEETTDAILQAAFELRSNQLQQADLILQCQPASEVTTSVAPPAELPPVHTPRSRSLHVITKIDEQPSAISTFQPADQVGVSAVTGAGLDNLKAHAVRLLGADRAGESHIVGSSAARCRDSLQQAIAALARAGDLAESGGGDEFLATDVREALEELGRITGALYTDDLLDRIFSKFCIGK